MHGLFTNSLARKVNMRGVNGKIGFLRLQIRDVVIAAVRRNRLTSEATEKEIDATIKRWIYLAPDRDGGRKERMKNKVREDRNTNQGTESSQETAEATVILHLETLVNVSTAEQVLISNIYSQHTEDIVSGATELTNAEIELKSTEKQTKKDNKGKTSESSDTVYYKLTLVTHQAAGSSYVTFAQIESPMAEVDTFNHRTLTSLG
ncbi:serine arginine repetitive matrix 2-like protein [Labeo rohita]|uniref:Serine arginine repetitive matrix 2-like protein n=1 Tax=Labeo rohita TaxID=84645 RepID=A0A498NMI4_LABRO|nr:serine arginine repetitive matrix 2-like protein [Labeo rohita]